MVSTAKEIYSNLRRESLIKILLILELEKRGKNYNISNRELDIIVYLYTIGGVSNKETMESFIGGCFEKGYIRNNSEQSIRNVLTKGRNLGLIRRRTANNWKVEIIPQVENEKMAVNCLLTDYDIYS